MYNSNVILFKERNNFKRSGEYIRSPARAQKKKNEPAIAAALTAAENLIPETPLSAGPSASDGDRDGEASSAAGPSEARLPGAGGDDTSASGEDEGVSVTAGDEAGLVEAAGEEDSGDEAGEEDSGDEAGEEDLGDEAGEEDLGEEACPGAGAEADVFGEAADGMGAVEALGVAALVGEEALGAAAVAGEEALGVAALAGEEAFGAAAPLEEVVGAGVWAGEGAAETAPATARATNATTMS
ncbi:hypothetical protein SAY86_006657 [Trapa natans]|uniref:Uncharacterized protein n=1 Tax=Trapa natans TaxID=22666 RepID=A0AAN7L7R9_TRANT|nr:hypothetical protein SAY86_006657 [Trapa natans]